MYRYVWLSALAFGMPCYAQLTLHDFLSCKGWNQIGRFADQRPDLDTLYQALQVMRDSQTIRTQQLYLRPIRPLYIYGNAPVRHVVLATQIAPAVTTVLLEIDLPAEQLKERMQQALSVSLAYSATDQVYRTTQTLTSLEAHHVRVLTVKAKGERSILYCGERLDPVSSPVTHVELDDHQLILR